MITWADKDSGSGTQANREVSDADMNQIKNNVNSVFNASRVSSAASASSITPDIDTYDTYLLSLLASNLTINASTGTHYESQPLTVKFKSDATPRTLSWNAEYRAMGATPPTISVASKWHFVFFTWNSTDSKYDCIGYVVQA